MTIPPLRTTPSVGTRPLRTTGDAIEVILTDLESQFIAAIPRAITALVFLTIAYFAIKLALATLRRALDRIYGDEQGLIVDLFTTTAGVFLWFGALLTLLEIVGMGELAASLGTATGFVALGVSFALSNMIADTVAGVYLLRDPDFTVGDTVTADSVTGTVVGIELRKSRFRLESGDVVVIANRDVEKRWTRREEPLEKTA